MVTKKRGGLGRGVDALIPQKPKEKTAESATKTAKEPKTTVKEVVKEVQVPADTYLKISDIEPNRDQPRKDFDKNSLEELADSISQYGVIQPIVVQKKKDYYEIIAGERRWRAAKMAKLKEVPVVIKDFNEQEVTEIALIENIQRKDLNPIEEATAYKNLLDEYKLTQEDLSKRLSKSRSAITNSIRLLTLPEAVQQYVVNGQLSMGHARAILSLEQVELKEKVAKRVVDKGLSVRETEKLVKNTLNPKQRKLPIPTTEQAHYRRLSEKLKNVFGTKVTINNKKDGKGKIEIEYYSVEELERLLEMFEKIED